MSSKIAPRQRKPKGIPANWTEINGMKLSEPQELLLKKMKDGAELRHHMDTGLFRLKDSITTRSVHPATVESLLRAGVINKALDGSCRLA